MKPARRSCLQQLALWTLAGVSLLGWLRLVRAILDWYWLERINITPGPLVVALGGALWGTLALIALVAAWRMRPAARWVGMAAVSGLAILYWADRLFFSRPDGAWVNLPFALALTVAALVAAYLLFFRRKIAARAVMISPPQPVRNDDIQ